MYMFDFTPKIFWIHSILTRIGQDDKNRVICYPIISTGSGNSQIYHLIDLSNVNSTYSSKNYFGEIYYSQSFVKIVDCTFSWYISGDLGASSQFNSRTNYYYLCTE